MRQSKLQRKIKVWNRIILEVLKHKDLIRFQHSVEIFTKNYGKCCGYQWYILRYTVFHNVILPKYTDTNVHNRNELIKLVKDVLGQGYANELQKISNKRTW